MSTAGATPPVPVARVVPDVTGLDKQFDYSVPEALRERVTVGTRVRVALHGRRVGGWVVELDPADAPVTTDRLVPIAAVSSVGPPASIVALARWAAVRWGVGRLRPFLVSASAPVMVRGLGPARRTVDVPVAPQVSSGVVVVPPLADPLPVVIDAARRGPCLVVHPSPLAAAAIARRLRRHGLTVALVPDEWAAAASGVDVVVGGRSAVWAPCPGLRSVVVLDEHDEALQEERTPTWHAREVAVRRAETEGAECRLVSPCPSGHALAWAGERVERPFEGQEIDLWPRLEIVDRTADERWSRSLLSSELVAVLRDRSLRVACVLNVKGRARLVACRRCSILQRCTSCDAAVAQTAEGRFECRRCGSERPQVCGACGATAMSLVRPGVTRLREEFAAAAARPVVEVTGESTDDRALSDSADVFVGTEAVLHRVRNIDVVAFLEFDAELLAPRYRSAEQALALLTRAGRLVGRRDGRGRVVVQTTVPDHAVLVAAAAADPLSLWPAESDRRRLLGMPPFRALAAVEGTGAHEFAVATGLEVARHAQGALVRSDDWWTLGSALTATERPKGSRLRLAVDPPRV